MADARVEITPFHRGLAKADDAGKAKAIFLAQRWRMRIAASERQCRDERTHFLPFDTCEQARRREELVDAIVDLLDAFDVESLHRPGRIEVTIR